jgi:integrase
MAGTYLRQGVWYVRWRDGIGKLRRKATSATTRREAQGLLDELVGQSQRVKLGLERAPVESRLTLKQLVTWWLDERCPEPSRENARGQLGKHVFGSELADYPLPALTPDLFEAKVFEPMAKAGSAPATINRVRGSLHSVFAAAALPPRKWSGQNPISETRVRKVEKRSHPTLTPDQVRAVLAEVGDPGWRSVMAVAAYLGLRRGEIYALKKSDYDREHNTLRVAASNQRATTKGGRHDTLPVPSILRPYLELARRTAGFWLFPDPHGRQRTREADPHKILRRACARVGLAEAWETYCLTCERAGRPNKQRSEAKPPATRCSVDGRMRRARAVPLAIRFHDLRHSCATNLLKAGVPLQHVQRILRHSSIRVTVDIYGHLGVEDLRAAVEAGNPSNESQRASTRQTQTEHREEVAR